MSQRRTNVQLLSDRLSKMPNQRASRKALAEALGWDIEKTVRIAEEAVRLETCPVQLGRGDSLIFTGSERQASIGLYSAVMAVLGSEDWGRRILRRKNIEIGETAKGGRRGHGKWIHPDLVITCDPLRRSNPIAPMEIHAVEVEAPGAFGIDSMYQAHSQGRGADFSWVVTNRNAIDKPGLDYRLPWISAEIGVGLITYEKISAPSTYKVVSFSKQRERNRNDRLIFLNNVLSESEESPLLGTSEYWRTLKRRS